MALDPVILSRIREWVGSSPDDATIETTFALAGNVTVESTALSILRKRRADMVTNPASFNVVGDYSQSTVRNLDALDASIRSLEQLAGVGEDVMSTGYLVRPPGR